MTRGRARSTRRRRAPPSRRSTSRSRATRRATTGRTASWCGSPGRLQIGEQGTATIRVLSASGVPVPDVDLTLTAEGAGIPAKASTGADGVASVQFTPRSADGVTITAKTEPIASTLPVYTPTVPAAATNGQRLVVPDSQTVTGSAKTAAFKAQARVASTSDPAEITWATR